MSAHSSPRPSESLKAITLPPELLSEIVLFALPSSDPSHFSASTYQQRITLLSNLSLLSRGFRSIADPILYSIFWGRNKRQLQAFIDAVNEKQNADQVRRLILAFDTGIVPKNQVLLAAETLTNVEELTLGEMKLGDLSAINGFSNVRSLTLSEVQHNENTCFTLPSLKELTIGRGCAIEMSKVGDENAPNLSALALRRRTRLGDWYPSLASTTPWNLDAFVLDWSSNYTWSGSLPNVLVDCELPSSSDFAYNYEMNSVKRSGVQHLRIYSPPSPYVYSPESNLRAIIKLVCDKPKPLETLILSPAFDLYSPPPLPYLNKTYESNELAKKLEEECLARDTELIFEEEPDRKFDSGVSKAFVKKMERLARARQDAEQQEKEE
ncbi:hypothetical protein JCM5350_007134 [Sporobolomyces pararoseus]